jgi:hypothetical protein
MAVKHLASTSMDTKLVPSSHKAVRQREQMALPVVTMKREKEIRLITFAWFFLLRAETYTMSQKEILTWLL